MMMDFTEAPTPEAGASRRKHDAAQHRGEPEEERYRCETVGGSSGPATPSWRKDAPYKTFVISREKVGNFSRTTGAYFFSGHRQGKTASISKKIFKGAGGDRRSHGFAGTGRSGGDQPSGTPCDEDAAFRKISRPAGFRQSF
jgi:hypothetical protein